MMTEPRDFATGDARAVTADELDTVSGGDTSISTGSRAGGGGPTTTTLAAAWNAFFRAAHLPELF